MGRLLGRNVDDEIAVWLRVRAAASGRSVEVEYREFQRAVRLAGARPDFWQQAANLRAETAGRGITPSDVLLREARDER